MSVTRLRLLLGSALLAVLFACDGPSADPSTAADQAAEVERTGFPLEVVNDLGMRFRLVPAGVFSMGSPEAEVGRDAEESLHEVHVIRPYYLQATEVTNAQFRAFRPQHTSGEGLDGDDQPVVGVSWHDAVGFAAWLAERDHRFVYRLPTEAEWEWGCRAGSTAPFASGEAPPAAHEPNAWGLADMHGGVAEWCHDGYGPYALWRQDNPQGAPSAAERVVRGGATADGPSRCRSAARAHRSPEARAPTVGFRLAFGLGYGRTTYGRHRVTVRTVDPTVEDPAARERPGWPMYMISVVDRLTDRVNQIPDPRWTLLEQPSPIELTLAPGIYYVFCYRMEGERRVRSIEMKFAIPGPTEVLCPIPRPYQAHPQ